MRLLAAEPDCTVAKTLTGRLAIPRWAEFAEEVGRLFADVRAQCTGGENATYIPILAEQDPTWFAVAITTVDGQQLVLGDTHVRFSIQSCVKPLAYAVCVEDMGLRRVHEHVGFEPSGLSFNEIALNKGGLPHNPMVREPWAALREGKSGESGGART